MLTAGEYTRGLHGAVKDAGHLNDLIRSGAVAAPAKGVISLVVKGDVEHRTEIEIESEKPQKLPCECAMPRDQDRISLLAKLPGIGRFVAQELESRDPPSLLVDGDDRLDGAELPKLISEPAQLPWSFDVPAKENESPWLDSADEIGVLRIH